MFFFPQNKSLVDLESPFTSELSLAFSFKQAHILPYPKYLPISSTQNFHLSPSTPIIYWLEIRSLPMPCPLTVLFMSLSLSFIRSWASIGWDIQFWVPEPTQQLIHNRYSNVRLNSYHFVIAGNDVICQRKNHVLDHGPFDIKDHVSLIIFNKATA